MDIGFDMLFDGRRLQASTVVDAFTRETLTIEVDQDIEGERGVDVVDRREAYNRDTAELQREPPCTALR